MSLRRNIRLRKEYLYRKSLEGKASDLYDKKQRIKKALREGKPVPTELRDEEASLRREIELEDERTAKYGSRASSLFPSAATGYDPSSIDDEYATATLRDPKICITTSRQPSSRLKQFAKEIRLLFPNSHRINRGSTTVQELISVTNRNDFTDVIVIQEHRGQPDGLIISHLPYGPTCHFQLLNCVMRHDIPDVGKASEAAPHLIFNGLETKLGQRIVTILKYCFPVPRASSQRVLTFSNTKDILSFRHHVFTKTPRDSTRKEDVELTECGPRFEMRPYLIKLGTLGQDEAETEWVYRPYMNTAGKKRLL
eukprot:g3735.t1